MNRLLPLLAMLAGLLPAPALERLEPAEGCYVGIHLGDSDNSWALTKRLGHTPAILGHFFAFPFSSAEKAAAENFLAEATAQGTIALLTLEPFGGLESVSAQDASALAELCAAREAEGIAGIMIRFGHEMNGAWYPWGQQPILYRQTFQMLAQAVHARTSRTAMLWAPNHGAGYPFGATRPAPGSPDFLAMDTDGNGFITESDDMYEPFYPGDDAVDWVGLTLYHWGNDYPWLENEIPPPNRFANSIREFRGSPRVNFYGRYCAGPARNKPMAIAETAAFYNTQQPGADEFVIKQAWWRQLFNISGDGLDVAAQFPKLKAINWFDHYKIEPEARTNWIDWRLSAELRIRSAFLEQIRAPHPKWPYFLMASEARDVNALFRIAPTEVPRLLPLSGTVSVKVAVAVPERTDLVVDLLDQKFQWLGGTRITVLPETQFVLANLRLQQRLVDGAAYRWSIFLTPEGKGFQQARAWCHVPEPVARAVSSDVRWLAVPPTAAAGSQIPVRVSYTAAASGFVTVSLSKAGQESLSSTTALTAPGSGILDLNVPVPAGLEHGTYALEAFFRDGQARAPNTPIQVENAPSDALHGFTQHATVSAGEVIRAVAGYSAAGNRELRVTLYDSLTNLLAEIRHPMKAGRGIRDLTLSHPSARPGDYTLRVTLVSSTPSGSPTVLGSFDQAIRVVPGGYTTWIDSHWGLALLNDPTGPGEDADADGANNFGEFLASTDPRDSADQLRVEIIASGERVTLRWRSKPGRNYRVWRTSDLNGGAWTQAGQVLPGTGGRLLLQLDPANAAGFYRVEAILAF